MTQPVVIVGESEYCAVCYIVPIVSMPEGATTCQGAALRRYLLGLLDSDE